MTSAALTVPHREQLLESAARHGMRHVRVFGSTARGEASQNSDLDLLVEVSPGRSLIDVVAFSQEAAAIIGRRVDVLTDGGVSPYLQERIYGEAIPL